MSPAKVTAILTQFEPLYGLTGTLWPIHLKPQPDELLSSWIIRFAHAHCYKVQTMCSMLFGANSAIWNRDIDRLAPQKVLDVLVRASGVEIGRLESTTLKAYEGTLFERHNEIGTCRWIVPLGVFHRSRRHPGLMYCPQCLNDDAVPYFRRQWRLAFSIVCTKHESYLQDECPVCKSPIAPHRSDMHGRQLFPSVYLHVHCWKCGFDLRNASPDAAQDRVLIALQARMNAVLAEGYTNWSGNPSMHSLIFFNGLRELIAGITSKQTLERLVKSAMLSSINLAHWPRAGFEMASLPVRRELFRLLTIVLKSWPITFKNLIHECKLRYADLKGDSEQRALWYEDVIQSEAGCGHTLLVGRDEAEAIANAVEVKHWRFSMDKARELSGHDIHAYVSDRLLTPVSDEVYEDLLTSIDHQIADTLDKIERACLIRDKVMFAVGRQLGLSQGELAELTLEQLRNLAPDTADLSFAEVARTPAQIRAWVEWYWVKIRPLLLPRLGINCVFTSAKTRRGLKHSAVGQRFNKLVNAGKAGRSVHGYVNWIT